MGELLSPVEDVSIAQFITEHWPVSNISTGAVYQTFPTRRAVRFACDQGEFVAKIDTQPQPEAALAQVYAIFSFLLERDFPHIPLLLKTRSGADFVHTGRRSISVMKYVAGGHPEWTSAAWRGLGEVAARLNAITDFPFDYRIPVAGAIRELEEYAADFPHRSQFLEFVADLSPLLNIAGTGLVHGEINLANAMRRQDGALVLLDWDEAGTGPTVLEAGYPLIVVFLDEELTFHREQATAFYRGYCGTRSLDDGARDLLFRAALLHALRYMRFANQQKRWDRICFAVQHREQLLSVVP